MNAILLITMYVRSVITRVLSLGVRNRLHHITYITTVIADIGSTISILYQKKPQK